MIGTIFLRQAYAEARLRLLRRINFRRRKNAEARRAYRAMSLKEFEGINARQAWANWRTIPKNLRGRLPQRPLRILDLCCGTGQSTEVLAYYAPPGSEILGLEFNPEFVAAARRRRYVDSAGRPVAAAFVAQSVLETFRDAAGRPLENESVDLVNTCGAVGSHFDLEATRVLTREMARVLKTGGLAMIDSGRAGTSREELTALFRELGFEQLSAAKSCFLDRSTQLCLRKKLAVNAGSAARR